MVKWLGMVRLRPIELQHRFPLLWPNFFWLGGDRYWCNILSGRFERLNRHDPHQRSSSQYCVYGTVSLDYSGSFLGPYHPFIHVSQSKASIPQILSDFQVEIDSLVLQEREEMPNASFNHDRRRLFSDWFSYWRPLKQRRAAIEGGQLGQTSNLKSPTQDSFTWRLLAESESHLGSNRQEIRLISSGLNHMHVSLCEELPFSH